MPFRMSGRMIEADDKAQDVMIRKLTRGNETVKAKFADVEASGGEG